MSKVGRSDVVTEWTPDGSCVFAAWLYEVDNLIVNVMFIVPGEDREGLVKAWHPRFGTNKLVFFDFK